MRDAIRKSDILVLFIIFIATGIYVVDRKIYSNAFQSMSASTRVSSSIDLQMGKGYLDPKVIFYNRVGKCGSRNSAENFGIARARLNSAVYKISVTNSDSGST